MGEHSRRLKVEELRLAMERKSSVTPGSQRSMSAEAASIADDLRWAQEQDLSAVLEQAMGMLARRSRTVVEMKAALSKKGFSEQQAQQAVERLKAAGYLNDEKLAEELASRLLREKLLSPRGAENELRKRGFPEQAIDLALETAFDGLSLLDLCVNALQRRLRASELTSENAMRHARALARAGWEGDLVRQALDKLSPGIVDELGAHIR